MILELVRRLPITHPTNQPTNQPKEKEKTKKFSQVCLQEYCFVTDVKDSIRKRIQCGYRLELLQTGTTEQPDLLNLAHLTLPEHLKLLLVLLLEMLVPQLLLLLS
jgi:hypothetical protein